MPRDEMPAERRDGGEETVLTERKPSREALEKDKATSSPLENREATTPTLNDSMMLGIAMSPTTVTKRTYSLCEMLGMFAVLFSYAFIFNTVNTIVIPKEIERLIPSRQSIWVGMIMAAGAISQLSTPIVGAWSDRAGHRTPFLIYGTFIVILGVVLFLISGTMNDISLLFAAHITTGVGLGIQYSMATALLNDYVVEEQVGKGSGTMAILAMLGSGAGYAMFASNVPLQYSYCSYILATVFCLGISIIFIPATPPGNPGPEFPKDSVFQKELSAVVATSTEARTTPQPKSFKRHSSIPTNTRCLEHVVNALSMPSPSRHPDFFFACIGRALFNTGLAGQVYLVYYLRDVINADNPVQVMSMVSVAALLGGVIGALPSGIISDRVGKKPVIYGSIVVCMISLVSFMLANKLQYLALVGLIYGLGNVGYLSVDYALGVQCLPRKPLNEDDRTLVPIDAAKDLGVFAMASTVGQLLGQVVYGWLLDQYGTTTATGTVYAHWGFVAIYMTGALCFFGSGIATFFIKGVK